MKKTYSILIPACLLLAACQTTVVSSSDSEESDAPIQPVSSEEHSVISSEEASDSSSKDTPVQDDISYEMGISGEEAVLKKVKGSSPVATIPATYEGKPVTRILDKAFEDKTKIQKVIVPENVVSIGVDAFNGCTNLTEVSLPSTLRNIGDRAFVGLRYMTSITIPEGVKSIGDVAFSNCAHLENISLPSTLKDLGSNLFSSNALVTSLYKGIEYLGNTNNPYLLAYKVNAKNAAPEEVELNPNTKIIGGSLFESESSLTKVTLNEGLVTIGASAFRSCPFESITIPSSVERIDEYAFSGCSNMTTCTISGNSLKVIEHEAFSGAVKLSSINIPSSVKEVGFYAFSEAENPGSLTFNEKDGGCYLGNSENPYHVFMGLKDTAATSLVIDEHTVVMAGQCLRDAKGISSLTIPASVETIGDEAFFQMTALTSMSIPATVKNMGANLFNSCSAITKIELLNKPTVLGSGFAGNCAKLTSFNIPDSVKKLGNHLFDRDEALTELYVPASVLEAVSNAVTSCSNLNVKVAAKDRPYLFDAMWCSGVKSLTYGANK